MFLWRVEKKERARLKTVKFNPKSRERGVSLAIRCQQSHETLLSKVLLKHVRVPFGSLLLPPRCQSQSTLPPFPPGCIQVILAAVCVSVYTSMTLTQALICWLMFPVLKRFCRQTFESQSLTNFSQSVFTLWTQKLTKDISKNNFSICETNKRYQ